MAQLKSRIWKYFKVCSNNESTAECKLCSEQSLTSKIIRGKTPKLFSTKPLWNHVKHKHPLVYKTQHENEDKDASKSYISNIQISDENLIIQEQQTYSQQSQPTLQMTIDRNKEWNFNDPKAKVISRKICK